MNGTIILFLFLIFNMSNMSYCRFRNTLKALQDCDDALSNENMELQTDDNEDGLSGEEHRAKEELIELCKDIARNN